jgi:hypothetical protein
MLLDFDTHRHEGVPFGERDQVLSHPEESDPVIRVSP